jgi:hypothetical protein
MGAKRGFWPLASRVAFCARTRRRADRFIKGKVAQLSQSLQAGRYRGALRSFLHVATVAILMNCPLAAMAAESIPNQPPIVGTPTAKEPAIAPNLQVPTANQTTVQTPPPSGVFVPDAPKVIIERGPCPGGGDCVRHCTNCHIGRPPALPFPRSRL